MRALFLTFLILPFLSAAQINISGTVVDETGEPLIGASVLELNSSNGAVTDLNGRFSLSVSDGTAVRFSMVGFEPVERRISSKTTALLIELRPSAELKEVVVTALGIKREQRALGYATTTLDAETMTYGRATNFGNGLAGLVAGLNVTSLATGPGGSSRLVLRGHQAISNSNQALIVVDGLPIDNTPLGQPDAFGNGGVDYGDGISGLNASDIESITVLKGNAAAALYGSRAGNGAILITTKKGSGRKGIGVEVNINNTWDKALVNMNLQRNYGQGWVLGKPLNAGAANGDINPAWGDSLEGGNVIQFDGLERPWQSTGDRFKEFYRTGNNFLYNVALSGGNENAHFRLAFSDLKSQSILPNSTYDRKNFTINAGSKLTDWLDISASVQYILDGGLNRPNVAGFGLNPNLSLAGIAPNVPLSAVAGENGDGSRPDGNSELAIGFMNNPFWSLYRVKREDRKDRLLGTLQGNLNLPLGFYGLFRIGNDRWSSDRLEFTPIGTLYAESGGINSSTTQLNTLTANGILGNRGHVGGFGYDVFAGAERYDYDGKFQGIAGNGIIVAGLESPTNQLNINPYAGSFGRFRTNGVFASTTLSWNAYLYATLTGRQDWFSTLPVEDAGQFFPSASLAFNFSEAFKMPSWMSFGKVRASWARSSGGTQSFLTNLTYSPVGQGHFGLPLNQITQATVPPQGLRPLISQEVEVGFDVRFFKNRLGLDVALYDQRTFDDLTLIQISNASGYSTALTNDGEIKNQGIELQLNAAAVQTRNFGWDVRFNLAKNQNEVVSLGQGVDNQQLAVANSQGLGFIHNVVGQPASVIMGFAYARDDDGNILYNRNVTTDPTGTVIWSEDYTPIQGEYTVLGNGIHDLVGGINNTVRYKNLSLDFLIDFKTGGDIFVGSNAWLTTMGYSQETAEARLFDHQVVGTNAADGSPINYTYSINDDLTSNDCYICHFSAISSTVSEPFVHDADFAKLRQVALTWSLPRSWSASMKAQYASISFVGRNMALLYSKVPNIDPESGYLNGNAQGLDFFGLPPTRSYGVDFRVGF